MIIIEYDPEKDTTNLVKHGVSLSLGAVVLDNCIGEVPDERMDYGEDRINAYGLVRGRLFVCTYTIRGEVYRMISVRLASRRERRRWPPS
jgi:uncharacterized protein